MSRTSELREWLSSESSPISNFSELSKSVVNTDVENFSESQDNNETTQGTTDFSDGSTSENETLEFSEDEIDEIVENSLQTFSEEN